MEKRTALVTGGAGYLGSHLCRKLKESGWNVIVFDRKNILDSYHSYYTKWFVGDITDYERVLEVLSYKNIDCVFHLAGRIEVGLSRKQPDDFWNANVVGTCNVLRAMKWWGIKKIVFSSTAAVYKPMPYSLSENSQIESNSVYGNTKIACENMIRDFGIKHGIFRFFNLAGAHPDCKIGETHMPETHLIPNIFKNLNNFRIYGNDYKTIDGTCIRDYVHVCDVADAHLLAADYLDNNDSFTLNLGTGLGMSIKEIIQLIELETGLKVNYTFDERRPGDPDILVANISKAKSLIGYNPRYDVVDIIKTAYEWHKKGEVV